MPIPRNCERDFDRPSGLRVWSPTPAAWHEATRRADKVAAQLVARGFRIVDGPRGWRVEPFPHLDLPR